MDFGFVVVAFVVGCIVGAKIMMPAAGSAEALQEQAVARGFATYACESEAGKCTFTWKAHP